MAHASSIARRYADAYFELAKEANDIAAWRRDLAGVAETFGNDQVESTLENPKLPLQERTRLGMQLLDGVAQPARNLARLLIERRRARIAEQILTHFDRLADREAGVVRAEVTAAVPVDTSLEGSLRKALADALRRPVQTSVRSDPSIIGGLVIRIGDRVIDDSVRTHLQQLQAALA